MFLLHLYSELNTKAFMKSIILTFLTKFYSLLFFLFVSNLVFSQEQPQETNFWQNVRFGGGVGLGFGNDYFSGTLAPGAIYNFNEMFAAGLGVQVSYTDQKHFYTSTIYGASVIGLFNPIEQIQLSLEAEQLRVNREYELYNTATTSFKDNFWATALFVGAGYRTQNVTFGARYNVLQDNSKNIYSNGFMPFVRVYF